MTQRVFNKWCLIFSAALICLTSFPTQGQQTVPIVEKPTQVRIIDYGGDLLALLSQLPSSFDATMGFEVDPLQPHSYVSLNMRDATFDDILQAIVRAKPNYALRRDGRFFEVYPRERSNSFLETKLVSFQTKDVTAAEAVKQVLGLLEVQTAMRLLHLQLAPTDSSPSNTGTRISIEVRDVTLRRTLNLIAAQSDGKFWVFQRSGPRDEFFTIKLSNTDY